MASNEYLVSLTIPVKYEYIKEWTEVQNIIQEDGGAFNVSDNEVEISFEQNGEPFSMLECLLKENRIPFDRHAELTWEVYNDVAICNRFFRPGGCICGGDYDKEFILGHDGVYNVPVDELQKLLADNENEKDAGIIKAKLQALIIEYSPHVKKIEDC